MRIYLDNNATTPLDPVVLGVLNDALRDVYGNASSVHQEGQTARRRIEDARDAVAILIGATSREIVFTSGGTESNNAAIFGVVGDHGRHHIVTTSIEHPSVLEPVQELARRGHGITLVPPARSGEVSSPAMLAAIRPDTRLVTMMLANNETGVVQPVEEVARACRERGIHFHCDAVQAVGKIAADVNALAVDSLAMGGHKFHAPKGIGALYVRHGLVLDRHLFGGSQERRRRAGTENVPLAVAFGAAAGIVRDLAPMNGVAALRDRLERELLGSELSITINGAGARRLPNTSSITFHGADAEGIVIGLDLKGVAVSTGSACSSGRVEPSRILSAMGLSDDDARSTLRISLSRFTRSAEIDRAVELIREVGPRCMRVAT